MSLMSSLENVRPRNVTQLESLEAALSATLDIPESEVWPIFAGFERLKLVLSL